MEWNLGLTVAQKEPSLSNILDFRDSDAYPVVGGSAVHIGKLEARRVSASS